MEPLYDASSLTLACCQGDVKSCNALLESGEMDSNANFYFTSGHRFGWGPLIGAIYAQSHGCVRALLKHRADPNEQIVHSLVVRDSAFRTFPLLQAALLEDTNILEEILSDERTEIDARVRDEYGSAWFGLTNASSPTAVEAAAKANNVKALTVLLMYGARISYEPSALPLTPIDRLQIPVNRFGNDLTCPALFYAFMYQSVDVVEALLCIKNVTIFSRVEQELSLFHSCPFGMFYVARSKGEKGRKLAHLILKAASVELNSPRDETSSRWKLNLLNVLLNQSILHSKTVLNVLLEDVCRRTTSDEYQVRRRAFRFLYDFVEEVKRFFRDNSFETQQDGVRRSDHTTEDEIIQIIIAKNVVGRLYSAAENPTGDYQGIDNLLQNLFKTYASRKSATVQNTGLLLANGIGPRYRMERWETHCNMHVFDIRKFLQDIFVEVSTPWGANHMRRMLNLDVLKFLVKNQHCHYTLHFCEYMCPARAKWLLQNGADIHISLRPQEIFIVSADGKLHVVPQHPKFRSNRPSFSEGCTLPMDRTFRNLGDGFWTPTPLSIAQGLYKEGKGEDGTAAYHILQAAKPWSRKRHYYWPVSSRDRARELIRVGYWFLYLESSATALPIELWEDEIISRCVWRL